MKYLGIDYGRARVGISLSDVEGKIAFPHTVLANNSAEEIIDAVCLLVREEGVENVVLGEPQAILGMVRDVREEIENFGKNLASRCPAKVHFEDEMFTTKIAEMHSKENSDASAAALILQSFLDKRNRVQ
ncbi:MAG: Holliday junction resolvase RuvX [Candidatus Sungbacteria bacterium]|uniref:Putative pre-16S rRNA nuclease n=1 Tax=Candidatus Sungiibacteriota bacterium TaxID=2750080 RepID=A0A9D6LRP4_9BACT|nr:Holliday junction resolvase RuvX [Candidatus Sungbacteria bacterium]